MDPLGALVQLQGQKDQRKEAGMKKIGDVADEFKAYGKATVMKKAGKALMDMGNINEENVKKVMVMFKLDDEEMKELLVTMKTFKDTFTAEKMREMYDSPLLDNPSLMNRVQEAGYDPTAVNTIGNAMGLLKQHKAIRDKTEMVVDEKGLPQWLEASPGTKAPPLTTTADLFGKRMDATGQVPKETPAEKDARLLKIKRKQEEVDLDIKKAEEGRTLETTKKKEGRAFKTDTLKNLRTRFDSLRSKYNNIKAGVGITIDSGEKASILQRLEKDMLTVKEQYGILGGDIKDLGTTDPRATLGEIERQENVIKDAKNRGTRIETYVKKTDPESFYSDRDQSIHYSDGRVHHIDEYEEVGGMFGVFQTWKLKENLSTPQPATPTVPTSVPTSVSPSESGGIDAGVPAGAKIYKNAQGIRIFKDPKTNQWMEIRE